MRSTWDSGGVQAFSTGLQTYIIHRFVQLGENIYLARRPLERAGDSFPTDLRRNVIDCEAFSAIGSNDKAQVDDNGRPIVPLFSPWTKSRWLLDNHSDSWEFNWYSYNHTVSRNPVDVLLSHLLLLAG